LDALLAAQGKGDPELSAPIRRGGRRLD
jgi:hypothetical protein